ncbi:MAG TPA: ABC transporter permease [Flavipsychrobacter sp.]|nr:ABC transporter permease [Flavipsychrobacter sp.]
MNKILLIIKREYITRIRNKTFIFSTILIPFFFIALVGATAYFSHSNSEELNIGVYDQSGLFIGKLKSNDNIHYTTVPRAIYDSFAAKSPVEPYNGVLYIPQLDIEHPKNIQYIAEKQLGIFSQAQVDDDLNDVLEQERMIRANIDTARLSAIKTNEISITQKLINEDEENTTANAAVSSAIGYMSGFLIYFLMFIYGTMVMRGIMEEKVSRVAEVMVSSVKPFQLMMGKIIGIGAVGITQFLIWVAFLVIGTTVFGASISPADVHQLADAQAQTKSLAIAGAMHQVVTQLNIPLLIGAFLFYFVFGYLFYAALFAAVGSAVNEDPQDAQAMMLPITIPIIFSIIIMTRAIANPTGSLAVWCSIIPFTSPIIMMARLPFGFPGTVAWWELALSVACMIGGFLFTTWLSAKIYRTGILMYGKKASWKDMLKWAFRK